MKAKKTHTLAIEEETRCPATGLPVRQDEQWTDMTVCDGYRVTFRLIGEQILHVIPDGPLDEIEDQRMYDLRRQVLNSAVQPGLPVVEIRDYEHISDSPSPATGLPGNGCIDQNIKAQCLGFIAFNVQRRLRTFIRLGFKVRKAHYPREVARDYVSAVRRAQEILSAGRVAPSPVAAPITDDFISDDRWQYAGGDFSTEHKVIKGKVMYTRYRGQMKAHHVEPALKTAREVMAAGEFQHTSYYQLSDFSGAEGGAWRARLKFLKGLKDLYTRYGPPRAIINWGGSRLVVATAKLMQKRLSTPIIFANNLEDALARVRKLETSSLTSGYDGPDRRNNRHRQYVDEILDFIASFAWDSPGKTLKTIPDSHPFKLVFDAITVIKQDIDELLAESRTSRREAEKASKAKSEFLANISHEIRTPLNGILGMADLLDMGQLTEDQRDLLGDLKFSGHSLMDIINEILDFSKIEAGKIELINKPFNLDEVVRRILRMTAIKANEKNLELLCRIDPDIGRGLVGDSLRLRQILINLVGNAVKFTDSGEVLLDISRKAETPKDLLLEFSVSDTGRGIADDQIAGLFDKFSQANSSTTKEYGGTGLGLAIARELVRLMGGRIKIRSAVGKGSRFYFQIRLEKTPRTMQTAVSPPAPPGTTALVVGGTETGRDILQELLEHWDIRTTSAGGVTGALAILKECRQKKQIPDLLLVDAQIPQEGEDGVVERTMNLFKQTAPPQEKGAEKTPEIILLSPGNIKGSREELNKMGVGQVLLKPVTRAALLRVMGQVFEGATDTASRDTAPDPKESATATSDPGPDNKLTPKKLTILLVEDNAINRKLVERVLKSRGWTVVNAVNGYEAIDLFREKKDTLDAVIMDIQMPGMDGYEASERIRELEGETDKRIPIIALTAHALADYRERSYSAGMDAHLTKPLQHRELFHLICRLTGGGEG